MPWIASSNLPDQAMEAMNASTSWKKHKWALSRYHVHTLCLAIGNSLRTYGTLSRRAVHPDLGNSGRVTIMDDSISDGRRGHQKSRFHRGLNVLDFGEATVTVD